MKEEYKANHMGLVFCPYGMVGYYNFRPIQKGRLRNSLKRSFRVLKLCSKSILTAIFL